MIRLEDNVIELIDKFLGSMFGILIMKRRMCFIRKSIFLSVEIFRFRILVLFMGWKVRENWWIEFENEVFELLGCVFMLENIGDIYID